MQGRAPRGEFLIARGNQRTAESGEFGMIRTVVREKRFNRRAVRKFDGVFRVTHDLFEPAKEKHLDTRGL